MQPHAGPERPLATMGNLLDLSHRDGIGLMLEALPEAIYLTDAAGHIVFYNAAAAELWGIRPELGESTFCGSWKLHRSDGSELRHDECPMAVALREGRAIRGVEAIAERPDGSRVPFLACPTPLFDASGALIGGINMLVDLSARMVADEATQRLAAIVDSSEDAILAKSLDGTITNWNRGAQRLFGYSAEEAIGKPIGMLIPADRHNDEPHILTRIRLGERIEHYETVRRRKDGSLVEISISASPIRNREGRIVGAAKIARDITERRRFEEQQQLLLREMDHRVKNLFSLASGIVTLSARAAENTDELVAAVTARLSALSQAHGLTVKREVEPGLADAALSLHALLRTIFAPYDQNDSVLTLSCPDIEIGGSAVTSIALLLHEFATNAAKHGALSIPSGRVAISGSEQDGRFILTWAESGGPAVSNQNHGIGFGTSLSDATVRGQFGGTIHREWNAEGLIIRLDIPMARLIG